MDDEAFGRPACDTRHSPAERVVDRTKSSAVSVLIALGVLVVCAALQINGTQRLAAANAELAARVQHEKHLRQRLDEQEKLAKQIREASQQREERDKAEALQRAREKQRQIKSRAIQDRPVKLLRALLATTGDEYCVHRIKLDHDHAVISGLAIDSTAATSLSERIELELDPSKWRVKRANISFAEDKNLVRFEITLVPSTVNLSHVTAVSYRSR